MSASDSSTPIIHYCLICGDRSSGLHYDIRTCNACAAFFRRSIAESRKYECEFERQCSIEYSQSTAMLKNATTNYSCLDAQNKRRMCKYCRLVKCSLVGLRSDGTVLCFKNKIDGRVIGVRRRSKPKSCRSRKVKLVEAGNIIELSPSVYCKLQTDLTILDKLQIKRRSIDSIRYHRYIQKSNDKVGVYLSSLSNCKFYLKN
jgi:membrane-bound inhibitor of C-type lysozyme